MIAGGQSGDVRAEVEIYDPNTSAFTSAGAMLSKRYQHTAVLLADGSVLLAGGFDAQSQANYTLPLASLERYLPGSGFMVGGGMATRRQAHAALRLANNKVLLVGGFSQSWMTSNTAELYDPSTAVAIAPPTLADGQPGVAYAPVVFVGVGGLGVGYNITFAGGALPPGMSYVASTRTLSGTPTASGVFTFSLRVSENGGGSNMQSFTLRVGTGNVITNPYSLPNAAQNHTYAVQLFATGVGPITWSLLPAASGLPPGITLSPSGLLSNPPTSTGFFSFGVRAIDTNGVEATEILAISVSQPLTITTTSLNNVDLFSGGPNCVSASNGNGTRTWDISLGALPAGLTINPTNGCFLGTVLSTGPFIFTVRVTDQSSPPQQATREFTINSWARDQDVGDNASQPTLTFGGTTRIAEQVITGISGTLHAVRVNQVVCGAGTVVTAEIQGLTPASMPDGIVVASGQAIAPFSSIALTAPQFFAADAQFAVVFSANQSCTVRPHSFDSYPGTGFVAPNGGPWQTLVSFDARHDLPFTTLIEPAAGLIYMSTWRGDHTETRLQNGKVLLTGGNRTNQADLFDPAANTVSPVINTTTNPPSIATMTIQRDGHTATLLNNGMVLIAGGSDSNGNRLATAEIFNPANGTFTAIAPMNGARSSHTATLLPDGKVLLAGGFNNGNLASAELFNTGGNPLTGTFTGLTMLSARTEHTATLLDDGRVLLAGGFSAGFGPNAELFSYGSLTFEATGNMVIHRGRHTATLLDDGNPATVNKVLLAGGTGNNEAQSSAELFDPSPSPQFPNGQFTAAPGMSTQRDDHTAVRLADGSVLVAGGLRDTTCCGTPHDPQASMERYVPGSGWVHAGSMLAARYRHTATQLGDGRVLLAGTWGWSSAAQRSAEIYDPANALYFTGSTSLLGTVGQPFSHELVPGGGTAPRTVSHVSGALPQGLSFLNSPVRIAGTPAAPGTFTPTFSITDGTGHVVYVTFTIRINPVVITTGSTLPNAYQNVAYSNGLSGSGVGSLTWQIVGGSLPPGLTLAANGTISGTPTVSCCTFFLTVRATDTIGQTATKAISINVQQPLNITTTSLGDGTAGNGYFGCIQTAGGNGQRTFSLTGAIPIGLAIDPSTGCFNQVSPLGVLRQAGTFTFNVNVQDQSVPAQQDTQPFSLKVHATDQQIGTDNSSNVSLSPPMRVAQVYRASSPFPLSGVQVFGLTCDVGTQATFSVYPVTGRPARPDDSGAPLASTTLTANSSGFFTFNAAFPSSVAIPQGSTFSVVVSFTDDCTGQGWMSQDFYRPGQAWVHNGVSWALATTSLGKQDLPFGTLVMPPSSLRFTAGWYGNQASAALTDGRVLLAGSDNRLELFDPAANSLTDVPGTMADQRGTATATRLSNNNILIVGGQSWNGTQNVASKSWSIYQPSAGAGTIVGNPLFDMVVGRFGHRATRLNDNRVLITGGWTYDGNGNQQTLQTALIFDATGSSFTTVNMTGARVKHSATVLPGGKVLIVGGWTAAPFPATVAEIFDPLTDTFTAVTHWPGKWPAQHTATLLTSGPHLGKVLIAGGSGGNFPDLDPTGLLFNPATETFSNYGTLAMARFEHTATALADGRVAFTGGVTDWFDNSSTPSIEIFNPLTHISTLAGNLVTDRQMHSTEVISIAGVDKLVVSGGFGWNSIAGKTSEVFDYLAAPLTITTASLPNGSIGVGYPSIQLFASGGSGAGYTFHVVWGQLPPGNPGSLIELLPGGQMSGIPTVAGVFEFVVRVQDSGGNTATRLLSIAVNKLTITSNAQLPAAVTGAFYSHQLTATGAGGFVWSLEPFNTLPGTIMLSPSGLLSGTAPNVETWSNFVIRVTDSSGQFALRNFNLQTTSNANWSAMNPMSIPRRSHIGIELDSGLVLLAGSELGSVTSSELYNPATNTTAPTGALNVARCYGCASVKLDNGTVLAAGGSTDGNFPMYNTAEIYDPQTGAWSFTTGNMTTARLGANAIKLLDGKVLILGGHDGSNEHITAEIYEPGAGTFSPTANTMSAARTGPAAVRLADGRVLVAGGNTTGHITVATADIYNPATNSFSPTGSMITARQSDHAVLLADGRVLIAGGYPATANAEVFNPSTNAFSAVASMSTPRSGHWMVKMPYGKVLVGGGVDQSGNPLSSVEMFDPATNAFTNVPSMLGARTFGNAIVLANGHVLITGGSVGISPPFLSSVEKYRP